jgi:hypothetical protein
VIGTQVLQEGFHSGDGDRPSRSGRRAARRRAHVPGARHVSDRADNASRRNGPERSGQSIWRLKDSGNRTVVYHNFDQRGHADKFQVARQRGGSARRSHLLRPSRRRDGRERSHGPRQHARQWRANTRRVVPGSRRKYYFRCSVSAITRRSISFGSKTP